METTIFQLKNRPDGGSRIRRAVVVVPLLAFAGGNVGTMLAERLAGPLDPAPRQAAFLFSAAFAAICAVVILLRSYRRSRRPYLALGDALLSWRDERSGFVAEMPYEELLLVRAAGEELLVLGRSGFVRFHESQFTGTRPQEVEERAIDEVAGKIRARIRSLPDGPARLQHMDRLEVPSLHNLSGWRRVRAMRATWATALILGVVFALEVVAGALVDPIALLALGANSPVLVQAGEWPRMITGNLLHADLMHLFFNLVALVSFGGALETLLGSRRFLLVFLAACLGGGVGSAVFGTALISVGASTGILGLVGAYGICDWRSAGTSEQRRRTLRRQGFVFFLALVLPALLIPNADHWGHLGGLTTGVLVATWVLPRRPDPEGLVRRDGWVRRLTAALLLIFAVATAATAERFLTREPLPTAMSLLRHAHGFDFLTNNAAWTVATHPEVGREQLETARRRMERVAAGDNPTERDTLATVTYRLGDFERAVELERPLLAVDGEDGFYAGQLARFELARWRRHGPILGGLPSPPRATVVHPPASGCPAAAGGETAASPGLRLDDVGTLPGKGAEVHVILLAEDSPKVLVRAVVGPGERFFHGGLDPSWLGCDVRAVVTLAEVAEAPEEGASWQAWELSQQALELP